MIRLLLERKSMTDLLLMKNEDGSINYLMVAVIYSMALMMIAASCSIIKEAFSPSESEKKS